MNLETPTVHREIHPAFVSYDQNCWYIFFEVIYIYISMYIYIYKSPSRDSPPKQLRSEDRDFVELFAGQGEVTKALRHAAWLLYPRTTAPPLPQIVNYIDTFCDFCSHQVSLRGAAIDLEHDPAIFDLTTPSGFVFLGGALGVLLQTAPQLPKNQPLGSSRTRQTC